MFVRSFGLAILFTTGLAAIASDTWQKTTYVGNDMKTSEAFWNDVQTVRLDTDERDVPAEIPGPADAGWAGATPKEVRIPLPFDRETILTLSLVDSHESAPPTVAVSVDGTEVARIAIEPGNGVPVAEQKEKGRPSSYQVTLPSPLGADHQVTLSPISGSWIGIDTITLSPVIAWWEPWRRLSPRAGLMLMTGAVLFALLFWLNDARREERLAEALGNITLMSVVGALTFALGEFLLATWYPQPDFSHALAVVYEKDDGAGYRLKPNVRTRMGYDTNRLGLRDYDRYRKTKPDGAYRILAVGDSQTFSWTALENAWPKLLEEGLSHGNDTVEVLNTGVPGYGTDDEYYYLAEYGQALAPDMVVLGLYVGNDLLENASAHDYTVVDGSKVRVDLAATVEEQELTWRKRVKEFASQFHWYRLARRFSFAHAFDTLHAKIASDTRERMNRAADSCVRVGDTRSHYAREEWRRPDVGGGMEEDWVKTVDYLDRIAQWCAAHNARLLIAVIPVEAQLDTPEAATFRAPIDASVVGQLRLDWNEPQKSLTTLAQEKGWPLVDLLPAMKNADANERLYYCNDIHLNETGSSLIAQVIGETIARQWPDLSFNLPLDRDSSGR